MGLTGPLLDLAARRSRKLAGGMLNGIVHNLNNPVHVLTLQMELLQKALGKDDLGVLRDNLRDRSDQMRRVVLELKSQVELLAWRDTYVSPEVQLLDPGHFGTWLLQFWQADLTFKHSITATLCIDPPPPHVQIVPLALTWCLEEPLRALARRCQALGGKGMTELELRVGPRGPLELEIALRGMPLNGEMPEVDEPIPYASEIRDLTSGLGWVWQVRQDSGRLMVQVIISTAAARAARRPGWAMQSATP